MPDIVKQRAFDRAFEAGRKVGAMKAIEPAKRLEAAQTIISKMHDKMLPPAGQED